MRSRTRGNIANREHRRNCPFADTGDKVAVSHLAGLAVEVRTASSLPQGVNLSGHRAGYALGILWKVVECRPYGGI